MRTFRFRPFLIVLIATLSVTASRADVSDSDNTVGPRKKDWTILTFMNGNSNLDSFADEDLIEMEKLGSTKKLNVVVQWAGMSKPTVKRLLVQKNVTGAQGVTSPTVEDLGAVDMGDHKKLLEFLKWGADHYPAKRYFVNVWNHGNGWAPGSANLAALLLGRAGSNGMESVRLTLRPRGPDDISFDDKTGNKISTRELGQVMQDFSKHIGKRIDVYGSDACLMGMVEIAGEMQGAVQVFVGSQENEPMKGWPYDIFLNSLNSNPKANPADLGAMLTRDYIASYQGGTQGTDDVTFSSMTLSRLPALGQALREVGEEMRKLPPADLAKARAATQSAMGFSRGMFVKDYIDVIDYFDQIDAAGLSVPVDSSKVRKAMKDLVLNSSTTPRFAKAHGASIWIPSTKRDFDEIADTYRSLKFVQLTGWDGFLEALNRE